MILKLLFDLYLLRSLITKRDEPNEIDSCCREINYENVCPPFRPILSAIGTPTYKLAKYLVPKLASITTNEFSVKDPFCFVEEIVNQNSNFIMGSLDVDFLFTNIPLEETNICCDTLFKETDIYDGYSKSEFKTLLSLTSKESYFFFNEVL